MLDFSSDNWGLAPFRFELMWLEDKEFPQMILDWWKEIKVEGWAAYRLATKLNLLMATKLNLLRFKIKEWAKKNFGDMRMQKAYMLEEIRSLDLK